MLAESKTKTESLCLDPKDLKKKIRRELYYARTICRTPIQIRQQTLKHLLSQDIFQRKLDEVYTDIASVKGIADNIKIIYRRRFNATRV